MIKLSGDAEREGRLAAKNVRQDRGRDTDAQGPPGKRTRPNP